MPVRIYSLAKDLGIDNKELLDYCDKLGIKGKGEDLFPRLFEYDMTSSSPTRVLILGAAGRDFHDFNTLYRDDPDHHVVAFTATQIPISVS